MRSARFGLNGFLIARDTEKEARETLREIVAKADGDRLGMWADSSFEDLVQYNDGFRTKLIGTPEQIAERIVEYRRRPRTGGRPCRK